MGDHNFDRCGLTAIGWIGLEIGRINYNYNLVSDDAGNVSHLRHFGVRLGNWVNHTLLGAFYLSICYRLPSPRAQVALRVKSPR